MAANLSGVLLRLVSVIVQPVTVICLVISVELNRIIARGVAFRVHAVRYVLLQEGSLVDCIQQISLNCRSNK